MIVAHELSLTLGQKTILDKVDFFIGEQQKIGFVGRNGAGKSTVLKMIAGSLASDSGTLSIEKNKKIAYLPQEVVFDSDKNVFDEACTAFADVIAMQEELAQLEECFATANGAHIDEKKVARYGHLLEECRHINVALLKVRVQEILNGLGFSQAMFLYPVATLSAGWKMRLVLAKLLLSNAHFYLFDEPTNHLDIVSKEWFLYFLKHCPAGFLLVSHDRFFLDHACNFILEIERGAVSMYTGNYTVYEKEKAARKELVRKAYDEQQREIKKKTETIERFRAKASKAAMAQSMLKALDKMELIEIEPELPALSFSFAHVVQPGRIVLDVENLAKSFGEKKIFENVSFQIARGERVALVAANGVGKSTLLNIISGKMDQNTGTFTLGHNVQAALFEQEQDMVLNKKNTILQEVEDVCKTSGARSQVRTLLGSFLFPGDDVHKKVGVLSGGEKNRVAMVKVLLAGANFLILDEPTNHLDLDSKRILRDALKAYTGTILFVSHDRTFLNDLSTVILELTQTGLRRYQGNYDDYLYYKSQQTGAGAQAVVLDKKPEKQASVSSDEAKPKVDGKRVYELTKKVGSLERKINQLEEKIPLLQDEFTKSAYGSDRYHQLVDEIERAEKSRIETYAAWEGFTSELADAKAGK